MIRFVPDTWAEWLLRPVAMAAPNGWVYAEILSPDFRFVAALVLAALLAIGLLRRRSGPALPWRALAALAALTVVSFVAWLATSGNGRYFMPFLIMVGPLCVALAARLRVTPAMRGFAITLIVAAQGFALAQNSPWKPFDSWEWIAWKEAPFFHVDTSALRDDGNSTYVTISNLTFGLVAPSFPASSRWVNLSVFDTADVVTDVPQYKPLEKILRSATRLRLFQRAQVRQMDARTLQPSQLAVDVFNGALVRHRLKLREPRDCQLLRSSSLSHLTMVTDDVAPEKKEDFLGRAGFWVCSLEYLQQPPARPEPTPQQVRAGKIFARVEAQCPHFFEPGQVKVTPLDDGIWSRSYPGSDAMLMLARNDVLYMKYERTLNPQLLASGEKVLKPDFRLDCNSFRGRSGLPWDREI